MSTKETISRRLFFGTTSEYFQIFTITQNHDSSIYFSAPQFKDITWHVPSLNENNELILSNYNVTQDGKLSIHASGLVHAKPHGVSGSTPFAIDGNTLKSKGFGTLNVRHLLSIFLSEPKHKPNSPAGARESDALMTTQEWHPYVLIFWAVPLMVKTISITTSFHDYELEEVPPLGSWGGFAFTSHGIIWFAYRTKYMSQWPKTPQACYNNGYTVPVFIGVEVGKCRIEYRQPNYTLNGNALEIAL